MTWYEIDHARLVLEHLCVSRRYHSCVLHRNSDSRLSWTGELLVEVPGVSPIEVKFRLDYPEAFPAILPEVYIVSPELPAEDLGHAWHRWPLSGAICYLKPSLWQIGTRADEIIAKVEDWYFNYLAVKSGLMISMPAVGRVRLSGEPDANE